MIECSLIHPLMASLRSSTKCLKYHDPVSTFEMPPLPFSTPLAALECGIWFDGHSVAVTFILALRRSSIMIHTNNCITGATNFQFIVSETIDHWEKFKSTC